MDWRQNRAILRADAWETLDFKSSEQAQGVPMPPIQKPAPEGARKVPLHSPAALEATRAIDLQALISGRSSCRKYTGEPLSQLELSFLLWAVQGVRGSRTPARTVRNVASAGNRHPFETYLAVRQIEGLTPGIYRYLPIEHALAEVAPAAALAADATAFSRRISDAAGGQPFVGTAAVVFFWTALPQRTEWRYMEASHKMIAIDAGHVCQNLYLAAQAIGCGTCAVAAYSQDESDRLLGVDGEDEFTIYLAPVGRRV